MRIEITEEKTTVTPKTTKIVVPYRELYEALAAANPDFPRGGSFELRFDPNTETLHITHT
jgi:hypothetical protein